MTLGPLDLKRIEEMFDDLRREEEEMTLEESIDMLVKVAEITDEQILANQQKIRKLGDDLGSMNQKFSRVLSRLDRRVRVLEALDAKRSED